MNYSDGYIPYWKLLGKTPVPCTEKQWIEWLETSPDRRVAFTELDDCEVSTVFLMHNHQIMEDEPMLFETMVFGSSKNRLCRRYATWNEAEEGHNQIVKMLKGEANGTEQLGDTSDRLEC